jgi:hypothetical protein
MIPFYNAETRAGATPPIDAGGVLKERHEIAVGELPPVARTPDLR